VISARAQRTRGRAVAAGLAVATVAVAADRLALFEIVHDKCLVDQRTNGAPAPCESVDLTAGDENGVAILKDRVGLAQFLAIPTRRITGIEAPEILETSTANYWRAAWAARSLMERRLNHALERDMVGLAINSSLARSQDQLHIHIDCIAPDVRATLAAHRDEFTEDWRPLSFNLRGRRYDGRRLASLDLADAAPFRLLAEGDPGAANNMGLETLVAVGATFASGPGFVLLSHRADPAVGDLAHGEDLLDHTCAVIE
jgi:CDP-diacylglycerol pyrophosphatase